jgi:hypothetical protein
MDHPSVNLSPHRSSYEDKQYSVGIDCPAVGMIYPVDSCESRLKSKDKFIKCSYGPDCPRFVGEKPKKAAGGSQEHHKKPRREPARRIHKCLCCSKEKFIQGRGLCRPCYNFHSVRGILDNYPKTRNLGATRAKT